MATAGALLPESASAQYFGRNKVQYRTFDFRVLRTENFDVYYYPAEETAARDGARMAERWYQRLSSILDHRFEERQPIIFYGSHPAFQQTTTLGGQIGEGTGGVTESAKQRVIMPLTGSYQETDHVLGHELVHAFQYDISGLGRSRGNVGASGRALGGAPLWFIEGMAEYLSSGPVDPYTALTLRDASLSGDVPTIEQLYSPSFFPYTWGHALWAYVAGRWGDASIGQILRLVGQGVNHEEAMERILNIPIEELSADWQVAIRRTYLPLLEERLEPRQIAQPLITEGTEGGRLNVGPAISPDGEWVAFLSELDFLDVELWLANARTGEVVRRLQKGAAFDPHFQSLSYINSAGSWSPDSRQFVFSALQGGNDILVFIDANGGTVREVEIPGVIEITTPSWSPDGRTIVFSGVTGGISDLYAYDIETQETRQLTNDVDANVHPNVSPDGSTVAFVTDSGEETDFGQLEYGGYRLALLDLATGAVTLVPRPARGSSTNPVWTPSGEGLYYVSTMSGIPNVYRVDIATGAVFRLTDLFGGVSGITELSPAITAARDEDRLLFTAVEDNGYNIYALAGTDDLAGEPVTPAELADASPPAPAVLPPSPRPAEGAFNRVAAYLDDPATGLPGTGAVAQWEVDPYRASLGLDYLGQPSIGATTGGIGGQGGLYGGVSAVFSDILGYHTVYGTLQAQGQLDEIGFSALYLNQKYRWNYGASTQRIPYIALGRSRVFEPESESGGQQIGILRDQVLRQRYFDTSLKGVAQYPFSPSRRLELTGGVRRISTDIQVMEVSGPAVIQGGQIVSFTPNAQDQFQLEGSSLAFNMLEVSPALVYDNSFFGYTSPFAGQRYRFQVTPTVGGLNFIEGLADYRRYLFFRPFTLAVQGLHFGRYGEDESVFGSLFLGQPSLVRGYYGVYGDCRSADVDCTERDSASLDQLFGTRIAVTKAEVRFPLIRQLVVGPIPFPPIEGYVFGDAGIAWAGDINPNFQRFGTDATSLEEDDERYLLTSGGVGARINLLGYVIVEINYVNAFELDRGWHWQFALQPGF
jgi:dipeptidyl aminopeptidase/acylaminoacyl peptidase